MLRLPLLLLLALAGCTRIVYADPIAGRSPEPRVIYADTSRPTRYASTAPRPASPPQHYTGPIPDTPPPWLCSGWNGTWSVWSIVQCPAGSKLESWGR